MARGTTQRVSKKEQVMLSGAKHPSEFSSLSPIAYFLMDPSLRSG